MTRSGSIRGVSLAAILFAGTVAAQAQTRYRDVPPPSPYGLPLPGLQTGPEEEEPIRPWRHWGDSRNDGEFVKGLIAPGYVEPSPPVQDGRRLRFCRQHPDQCDD